ncbi:MAG: hypothetical protein ACJA1C_001932 [Crocinitomicaceae bacterium]|jgi:hypothetical protein
MKLAAFKSFFVVALTLFAASYAHSQENEVLMPYLKGELYGYSNSKGEIIIEPKYDYALLFKNGYALVRLGYKWGLIKEDGQVIFEPTANSLSPFDSNGLSEVKVNNQFGVINEKGEWVVPLEHPWGELNSYFIQVTNSLRQSALLDLSGKTIVDFKYNYFFFPEMSSINSNLVITELDEQFGLIQIKKNGKYDIKITPRYKSLKKLNNHFFQARQNDKLGLVNLNGEIIAPFEYSDLKPEGQFIITEQEITYEKKIKVIEFDGYMSSRRWDEIDKEYDEKNKIVYFLMTQKEQDQALSYGVKINEVPHLRRLYSLINSQGEIIIPAQYGEININKYLIQVKTDDGTTLFNKKGTQISSLLFDQVDELKEGLILVKVPSQKNEVENSNEADAMIKYFNRFKYGFIDTTGKIILPLNYNGALHLTRAVLQ